MSASRHGARASARAAGGQGAPTKPRDVAEFQNLLLAARARLTPRMLEAGGYIIDNPQEIALNPLATLADRSGLAPSTFVRLAQMMGFAGFTEMQRLFRAPLRQAYPSSLAERILHSQGEQVIADPGDSVGLGRSFCKANIASLEHLAATLDAMPLDAAIDLTLSARVIHVIGVDRSSATAAYLAYALNRMGLQAVQFSGIGRAVEDQARGMKPGDLLIAISFPPYAPETLAIVERARAKGAPILAITNSAVSPIAAGAAQALLVNDAELHGFRSLTAVISLAQTLIIGVAYRLRRDTGDLDLDGVNA